MDSRQIFTVAALLAACGMAQGQIFSYVSGNGTNFNADANWNSGSAPNAPSHLAFVGNMDNVENFGVFLSQDTLLGGLTISDGMELRTDDRSLSVDGAVSVVGRNGSVRSTLLIDGPYGVFDASLGDVAVTQGARLLTRAFSDWGALGTIEIGQDSFFAGQGFIQVGQYGGVGFRNDGMIDVFNSSDSMMLLFAINGASIDLDGVSEQGDVRIRPAFASDGHGARLRVSGTIEPFAGRLDIGAFGTFDHAQGGDRFVLESGGVIDLASAENQPSRAIGDPYDLAGRVIASGPSGRFEAETVFRESVVVEVLAEASLAFIADSTVEGGHFTVHEDGSLDFGALTQPIENAEFTLYGGGVTASWIRTSGTNTPGQARITGHGTVASQIDNNGVLSADGGTLNFPSWNGVDFDGSENTGSLLAETGSLIINHETSIPFAGSMSIGPTHRIEFTVGELEMLADSVLSISGGTLVALDARFGGVAQLNGPVRFSATSTFDSGSETTLASTLTLDGDAVVRAGAAIARSSDSAALVNQVGRDLRVDDGSVLSVDVRNNGRLRVAQAIGQAGIDGDLYIGGTTELDVRGTDVGLFDHLEVSGTIEARGTIRVISNGYSPALGDELDILDFGAFVDLGYTLDLPVLPQGLTWDVSTFDVDGALRIGLGPCGVADVSLPYGVLDLADIDVFITAFDDGDPSVGDLNDDSVVDLTDTDLFISAFLAGCP